MDRQEINELVVFDGSVDFAVGAWLHEKANRSGSENTKRVYARTLADYRAQLAQVGLDLDGNTRSLGLVLQAFAAGTSRGMEAGSVSASTYNLRIATISSFYRYCRRHGLLGSPDNPADYVERRPNQHYRNAQPLDDKDIRDSLTAINRYTLAGKRDYSMLLLALTTGRRLSELAGLKWGNVYYNRGETTVTFERTKGGKVMRDKLAPEVAKSLHIWANAYTSQLGSESWPAHDWPVWISLSRNGTFGNQLSVHALEQICEKRLGTSRFHALRHTFAHAMEEAGAKVSDIQARLGHSNIATTGIYLASLRSDENQFASDLSKLFVGEE